MPAQKVTTESIYQQGKRTKQEEMDIEIFKGR